MVGLLHSRRFSIFLLTLVALLALVALNVSTDITGPLAIGLGGSLAVLLGAESMVDRERAKHAGAPAAEPAAPSEEPGQAEDPVRGAIARVVEAFAPMLLTELMPKKQIEAPPPGQCLRCEVERPAPIHELPHGEVGREYNCALMDMGGTHLAPGSDWTISGEVPEGLRLEKGKYSHWVNLVGTPREPVCNRTFTIVRESDGKRGEFLLFIHAARQAA